MSYEPKEVAKVVLQRATKAGATEAEALIEMNRELRVSVRDGRAESVKQADTRGLGLRVMIDGRTALVYTSDFRPDALGTLAERAVALARSAPPDPANVLAKPEALPDAKFETHDPAVAALKPEQVIALAIETEKAARAVDPRVTGTDGAGTFCAAGESWVVNTHGVELHYPATGIGVYLAALADDTEGKQRSGSDSSAKRYLADLRPAEEIGREAGRRAVRMIGAKKVPTTRLPVLMHADVVAGWMRSIFSAFSGEMVFRKASYLGDKLDQEVASPLITLVDDPLRRRALGGAPFDDEGVPTRRVVLLEKGVVKNFVYNLRWASKAGKQSTGHAVRGYSSVPRIGAHDLYLENGDTPVEDMIKGLDRGFYLTDTGAFGYDPATGGWSYQASGLMIENGAITYPVADVSLASDTLTMLKGVLKVGNDLRFDGTTSAPHLLIQEMALSGT